MFFMSFSCVFASLLWGGVKYLPTSYSRDQIGQKKFELGVRLKLWHQQEKILILKNALSFREDALLVRIQESELIAL